MAASDKIKVEGLTFDDVLLIPSYSEIFPRDVSISSKFTRNIALPTPIVSAAMDTVTESNLAIAIAQEGGIGVLHKNMPIEQQAGEVRKVKRSESGMIQDPVTVNEGVTIGEVLNLMKEHSIGGIPVKGVEGKLVGIVTNRDLRFEKDMNKSIAEVMTSEGLVTANETTDLDQAEEILQKHKIEKLPVVDNDYNLKGLITFKDIIKSRVKPNACKDEYGRLRVSAAVGVTADTEARVEALEAAGVDAIIIDTAHGHSMRVIETFKEVKANHPELDIIVGNIGTGEAARKLLDEGVDGVKVGIGPGSICTTRVIAGVGVPQLTAIMEVYDAIKGSGVPIIGDGGIRFSGDIVKALAAGADSIMAGSMFAGVEESPGETIIYEGRRFKAYRGMGSIEAMQKGSKDRYFQDTEEDIKKLVPEGISGRVPYKGKLAEVIYQMTGGLRAGMGYCGAADLAALKQAQFVRVTSAGVVESHPHDVFITREAPNYTRK